MDENKNRDIILDIMKGVSILFVVLGHTYNAFCHNFIYLFHVSIFFIISGYFFNPVYVEAKENFLLLLKKRFLSLWVPYVSYNFLALLFQNFFLKIGFLTSDKEAYSLLGCFLPDGCTNFVNVKTALIYILKSFLFMNSRPFVGGLWFLGGLFFVTFLYAVVQFILLKIKHENLHIFFSIFFLLCGFLFEYFHLPSKIGLFKQIDIILISEIIFTLGVLIKKYDIINILKNIKIIFRVLIFFSVFIVLIVLSSFGTISIASRVIVNPLFYCFASSLGVIFILYLSLCINRIPFLRIVFVYIGEHTIPILALHTLSFKIITIIQCFLFDSDKIVLAAYPVWQNSFIWSILYLFVGIIVPIMITYPFGKIKILRKIFAL